MKAKDCLLYSKDKYKTVGDAWSHIVNILSYSCYYPENYKPKNQNIAKNWVEEIEELFNEFKTLGWVYLNEKGNWVFRDLSIENGMNLIS